MTHVSLFSGIGGMDLAAEWAGFETVLQVENDDYCRRVLAKHWPDVPRIQDVREVHTDERWNEPTVISGGFPCQPFSAAGKRRGTGDDRYLWPELLRIVEELQPAFVVGENVSGLLSIDGGMEIDRMLASLEARDYTPWILHYPAAGVGAPHRRDRVFIVAHSKCDGWQSWRPECAGQQGRPSPISTGGNVAHADQSGSQGRNGEKLRKRADERTAGESGAYVADATQQLPHRSGESWRRGREHTDGSWWQSEPDVGRVAHGIPRRVDRLRALGNAVVPQHAYPIFAAIAATLDDFE